MLPPRKLAIAAPSFASGLSFSPDGRWLYFVALDLDPTYQVARLYRYDVDAGTLEVVHRDLRGAGGSLTPDGRRYVFARADGDHHDLAELDLATGAMRVIAREPHGAFVAIPRVSPDGTRIVATRFDGQRFRIVLVDARDGRLLATLPTGDEPVHDASWVDDHRVVFLGGAPADAGFQVYDYDLDSGRSAKLTHAPFLAFQPSAAGGQTLRFLNREGWEWTLDEIPLPPRAPPPPVQIESAPPVAAAPAPAANAAAPPAANDATPPAAAAAPAPPRRCDARARRRADGPGHAAARSAPRARRDEHHPALRRRHAGEPDRSPVHSAAVRTDVHRRRAPGDIPGRRAVRRRPDWIASAGRWPGYFQLRRRGQRRRLVRLLEPAARAADAVARRRRRSRSRTRRRSSTATPSTAADYTLRRRDSELSVDAVRLFYDNPVSLGFALRRELAPRRSRPSSCRCCRIGGPHLSARTRAPRRRRTRARAASSSRRSTPPLTRSRWSSAGFGFADLRGEVAAIVPLPFYRRHTLLFDLRGRDLAGVAGGRRPAARRRLRPAAARASRPDQPEVPVTDYPFLPPGALFVEPLRGFEDYPFAVDRIAIGSATYRLPIIIDYGWASTLGLLPALFVRQVDFDLFAVAASDGHSGGRHSAAGGSLSLQLRCSGSSRSPCSTSSPAGFTDDQALVHLVQIGL